MPSPTPLRSATLALLVAAGTLAAPTPAGADVLTPNEVLRVEFAIDNNFNLTPNTLSLHFGFLTVLQAFTSRSAAIYDGTTLLGIDTKTSFGSHVGLLHLGPSNSFVSSTSPFSFKNPAVIDFTSILDGTIQGRIDFTIATGAIDLNLGTVELTLLRATSASGGNPVTPVPTLLSVEIVGDLGTSYCSPAQPNSTGAPAFISASGSALAGGNPLNLAADGMPQNQFGYFLASRTQGLFMPPGSGGFICLGGNIGRFNRPGEVMNSGPAGAFDLDVDTTDLPLIPSAIQPGETWNFQGWFRDGASSNFTDALEIAFL